MPVIKQRPSFNQDWLKSVSKQEAIDLHPLADVDYVSGEWEAVNGKETAKGKPKAVVDDIKGE